ncbi:hypothetical protein ACFLR1_00235 [Bacteroidota bacterium]
MFGSWVHRAVILVAFALHFCIAYWVDRTNAVLVISIYASLWLVFLIQWNALKLRVKQIFGLGVLMRLVYLFSMPELSDDVFRYIWDGLLVAQGISPYEILPSEWIKTSTSSAFQELFPLLNSPNYYSIYPPVLQCFFGLSAWLANGSVSGAIVLLRVFELAAELGSMWLIIRLLAAWKMDARGLMFYALNPLIIVEFTGNLHGETFMVFFLFLSLWLLIKRWFWISAVAFAGAVAVKLLPLMFLPFYIKRLGWIKTMLYGTLTGIMVAIMFLPFWSPVMGANILQSVDLYFAKFEFNASVYYIIRAVGFKVVGYNIIGQTAVWLPKIVLGSILLLALLNKDKQLSGLPKVMLFAWFIYYAFATAVNPWYVAVMAAFLPFVKYRFVLIWQMLIPLSYYAYGNADYQESMTLLVLEYAPVYLWLGLELFRGETELSFKPLK